MQSTTTAFPRSEADGQRTPAAPLPAGLTADLRTDHASKRGAVMIDRGILAITRRIAHRDQAVLLHVRRRRSLSDALRLWTGWVGAGSRGVVKPCRAL